MQNNAPYFVMDRLQGEPVDFIVQSATDLRLRTLGKLIIIFLGMFSWILIFPLAFSIPLIQLLITGSTEITVNGVNQTFTRANPWEPIFFMLLPTVIVSFFIIPGVFFFLKGISYLRQKGSWYSGTNKYLIEFNNQNVFYYLWNEFERTLETKTNKDGSLDIYLIHKNQISQPQEEIQQNFKDFNLNMTVNGKPVDLSQYFDRGLYKNKIGLLGLTDGKLVFDMIRHNMERYGSSPTVK